jgi:nucleotide-binding universal stress UspA family protein
MKILLAIDGSDFSSAATRDVADRPWPPASEVRIISVVELPFLPTPETMALPESYYGQFEKTAREQAKEAIESARKFFDNHPELRITSDVLSGRAKDVILEEAEGWGADLIVVGSHGYHGWQKLLLGSVSQAVAAQAKCSVEIVRTRQE